MDKEKRKYYEGKYRHLNLHFPHGPGWDKLTLIAAMELDTYWPDWMPNWLKRLNNRLLYAYGGRSIIKITKFYYSPWRKLLPFIKDYPRFMQIKEKWGGLRLYGSAELEGPLESLSYRICEDCGSGHAVGQTDGWVKTICQSCADEQNTTLRKRES